MVHLLSPLYNVLYGCMVKNFFCVSGNYSLSLFILVVQTFVFLSVCNGMAVVSDALLSLHTRDVSPFYLWLCIYLTIPVLLVSVFSNIVWPQNAFLALTSRIPRHKQALLLIWYPLGVFFPPSPETFVPH